MNPQITTLLDELEKQITDARDCVIEGADPTAGSANDTLHGLYALRCACLTLKELREAIAPVDGGSEIREMATALARGHHGKGADQ